ncbi:MAG TPA: 50S ribosomal protein L21 [Ignavibacteria bacterium]|nr:50S ribosomal protein L21 [Ignavibacteria bacterium]
MFAVVDILGQQFKVAENETHYVPKLNENKETITFDKVLLHSDENGIKIGNPYVEGVKVEAKILGDVKDEKIVVFKKKRRTGYEKKNGHRQQLTKIEITKISRLEEEIKDGS